MNSANCSNCRLYGCGAMLRRCHVIHWRPTISFRGTLCARSSNSVPSSGNIVLRERTIERLQLGADVLAKNLVLAHYETRIAAIFDRIEPLAATLRKRAGPARGRELLQHIGNVLAMQHKMVGRVETGEKPELLWEHPELERLYMRLMCASLTNTNCANATGRSTASSTSSRAPSKPCSASSRPAAAPGSNGISCC